MKVKTSKPAVKVPGGIVCLLVVGGFFWYLGHVMGTPNMLNTLMRTAHDLLLNTVFYLMGICVLTGALGRIFIEFGVVSLVEKLLRPLMKPLFNLPGVASIGAVMTFLSDNPAIISLAEDKRFSSYFKKYQYISLTNFGTAFGMGLLVIVFMAGQGYYTEPLIGLFGAFCGCIVSTRLMQHFVLKEYPSYRDEDACEAQPILPEEEGKEHKSVFIRVLNALLDPVFIYVLGWGSAGAAVSTVVTTFLSACMMFYWIFVMKKSYLRLKVENIVRRNYDKEIIKDILGTGIPASFELLMLSLASVLFYSFIRDTGGDQGVAVYSSGYRLYLIDLMPITSISLASVAIIGTHFGSKNFNFLKRTHTYCCTYAFIIALATTLLINIFPQEFASLFALTSDDTQLIDGISHFISITAFCMPFLALGLPSTFMYLGLGKGKISLMWATINEIVCAVPATYILGVVMDYGLTGIWMGFVVGRGIACTCNFFLSRRYISHLEKEMITTTQI